MDSSDATKSGLPSPFPSGEEPTSKPKIKPSPGKMSGKAVTREKPSFAAAGKGIASRMAAFEGPSKPPTPSLQTRSTPIKVYHQSKDDASLSFVSITGLPPSETVAGLRKAIADKLGKKVATIALIFDDSTTKKKKLTPKLSECLPDSTKIKDLNLTKATQKGALRWVEMPQADLEGSIPAIPKRVTPSPETPPLTPQELFIHNFIESFLTSATQNTPKKALIDGLMDALTTKFPGKVFDKQQIKDTALKHYVSSAANQWNVKNQDAIKQHEVETFTKSVKETIKDLEARLETASAPLKTFLKKGDTLTYFNLEKSVIGTTEWLEKVGGERTKDEQIIFDAYILVRNILDELNRRKDSLKYSRPSSDNLFIFPDKEKYDSFHRAQFDAFVEHLSKDISSELGTDPTSKDLKKMARDAFNEIIRDANRKKIAPQVRREL
jgi:hypothetical protein